MRVAGLILVAALAVLSMLASGCLSRTEGKLGHASFSYEECLFGCAVGDNALAAGGASAVIQLQLESGYSFTQIRSTVPSVAQFSLGTGLTIDVSAGAPGATQLELIDGAGRLVDSVTVTVKPTATLAITKGWSGSAPLVLEGSQQIFHVTTKDGGGQTLIGSGAVRFDVGPPLRLLPALTAGDTLAFSGAPGSGSIAARCNSANALQPVTVVPLAALKSIDATVGPNSVEGQNSYANVDVVAHGAGGDVYGATCSWTVSDPSVTVASQVASSLESAPRASTRLLLARAGSFSARCAIGALSTSVQLHR